MTAPTCPLDAKPIHDNAATCPCPPLFRDARYCPDCPLREAAS